MTSTRGSEWLRWDVHIHAPGTALANRFPCDAWDAYIEGISAAKPAAVALGITDYLSIDDYVKVRRRWADGELPGVKLVFPNVEFRLSVSTHEARGINLHLLFSPDEDDHIDRIQHKLAALTFSFSGTQFACTRADLIRLGKACAPTLQDESAQYRKGVEQFKVEFSALREWYRGDDWLKKNCLVAVAGGTNDGTSGLQKDDAFVAFRTNIERFAHIIFSSAPADRAFWVGEKSLSIDELRRQYDGPKPCLHGSDAHSLDDVLQPTDDKRCWIRAEPTFEGLRQVVFEPKERVHIGPDRPSRPLQNWIRSVAVRRRSWFPSEKIELNEGIVSIIGPRGSGKTALADLIAQGTDCFEPGPASFLRKAMPHVVGSVVRIEWADRDQDVERGVGNDPADSPSVRYLSQHFVEQLCSEEGASARLVEEIESVVFNALDETDRGDASSFPELRETVTTGSRQAADKLRVAIAERSAEIARVQAAKGNLPANKSRLQALDQELTKLAKARSSVVVKGKEKKGKELDRIQKELDECERKVGALKKIERRLGELRAECDRRQREYDEFFERTKEELLALGVAEADAQAFRVTFAGDVIGILDRRLKAVRRGITIQTEGSKPPLRGERPLVVLRKELEALQKEIGGDTVKERNLVELQKKERTTRQERDKLAEQIRRTEAADLKKVDARRMSRYVDLFDEFSREREALSKLYKPLEERLASAPEERRRLGFSVRNVVDVKAWAARGEALIDLRKKGEFQARGSLAAKAEELLGSPWRSGNRQAIRKGMTALVQLFSDAAQILAPTCTLANFADWLFSTDHIQVSYAIAYENTNIEDLSPGTRGIVLLILYLALDETDDRPLLIDQPEENLDPQSVFDVLTDYFREARRRRQVIMVTHNPNLVVNTDSDQVIIANAIRVPGEPLPRISYTAGALENPEVRKRVCQILEGGEQAFLQRERRYGLR